MNSAENIMDGIAASRDSLDFDAVVAQYVELWEGGVSMPATEWLTENSVLWGHRVVVLDVALEEYCRRRHAGTPIDREAFCQGFRHYAADVAAMVEIEDAIEGEARRCDSNPVPIIGERFYNFEILEHLGGGGLAQVYLAKEPEESGHRFCVLKVSQHVTREASILGRLEHPRIAEFRAVQIATRTNQYVLSMPYRGRMTLLDVIRLKSKQPDADGEAILQYARKSAFLPIRDLERDRPWPRKNDYFSAVVMLLRQTAEALEHAHRNNVVHGDIKPANILISFSGHVLLIDFNLAFDGVAALYRLGGTPAYVAPEMVTLIDQYHAIDQVRPTAAADIYSWGVVAWELLTGELSAGSICNSRRPNLSQLNRVHQERQRKFKIPALLERGVDSNLAQLIMRCLAVAPDERPRASELVTQLYGWNTGRRRLWRWVWNRRQRIMPLGGIAAIIIIGVMGWLITQPPRTIQELVAGRDALLAGDLENASLHVSHLLKDSPPSIDVKILQAQIMATQGSYLAAAGTYEPLQHSVPRASRPQIYARHGYCRAMLNDYETAVKLLRQAISSGLDEDWVIHDLGVVLVRQRQFAEAFETLTQAINANPDNALSYLCRADSTAYDTGFVSSDKLQAARKDIDKSIELGGPHADHFLIQAILWDRDPDETSRQRQVKESLLQANELGLETTSPVFQRLAKKYSFALPPLSGPDSHPRYTPKQRFISPPIFH